MGRMLSDYSGRELDSLADRYLEPEDDDTDMEEEDQDDVDKEDEEIDRALCLFRTAIEAREFCEVLDEREDPMDSIRTFMEISTDPDSAVAEDLGVLCGHFGKDKVASMLSECVKHG